MIDLAVNEERLARAVARAKEKKIVLPTYAQQKNPDLIPASVKESLKDVGLWDINPLNLYRITWKNQPVDKGGLYGGVNYVVLPPEITGVKAKIIGLAGKWFPTGAHKVGATFGCLIPRLVTGQFDPTSSKAAWPSTGNYCRGGAYNSQLLACDSIAILPEGMSKERFEWLQTVAGEIIRTPGSESNVKEIFDMCWEIKRTRDDVVIFNQFDELGNYVWHYEITGSAMVDALREVMGSRDRLAGVVLTTGSAGTIAGGDRLKELWPESKIAAAETLQCPTLLNNGFGAHRIEGIGDKHVPWIHNVRNTDMVIAVDDNGSLAVARLFNDPVGHEYLKQQGVSPELIEKLSWLGISGISNMQGAIKFAKYYELTEEDYVMTVFTDSMAMYQSRLEEMNQEFGPYTPVQAAVDYHRHLQAVGTDNLQELTFQDKKRVHNLKYYTWIEQQGKELDELNAQWYDHREYWGGLRLMVDKIDRLIEDFNRRVAGE
jgi:cysteine synthase